MPESSAATAAANAPPRPAARSTGMAPMARANGRVHLLSTYFFSMRIRG